MSLDSFLDECPFLPGFSYTSTLVDAARDLSSNLLASPSNEFQYFETATHDVETLSDIFTESLDQWGTPPYDQLVDPDASSDWVILGEPKPESSSTSKQRVLTRPYAGYHRPMDTISVPPSSSFSASPPMFEVNESSSFSADDDDHSAEDCPTVPLGAASDTHDAYAPPSFIDPQELMVRVEGAPEPPSAVPVPSVRLTIPLPKRSTTVPSARVPMSASFTFNVTTAQDADSETDDDADSDYVETHTTWRKRRAPASKPKGTHTASKVGAASKRRAPKREQAPPTPPSDADADAESGLSEPNIPKPIAIAVGGSTRFRCPAPGCKHTLDTPGGITRHYPGAHLRLLSPCPLGCGTQFKNPRNHLVMRHLEHSCKASEREKDRCIAKLAAKMKTRRRRSK
ncbi:hypothetical protein FB451DRAFT_1558155 [Mycena latifolia]|nr:hypothetical protein FB451DRAFT_1558155 [Mycena latifolia]